MNYSHNDFSVAIIEPVGGHGGMNYYDFGLVGGLRNAGVNVSLYTCDKTIVSEQFKNTTFCFFKKIFGAQPKFIRFFNFVRGLLASLVQAKHNNVKIVHYHFFHYALPELLMVVFARLIGMRIVVTAHDVESFVSGSSSMISEYIFKNSDFIIVHNRLSKSAVCGLSDFISHKISVVPHGDYLEFLSNAPARDVARRKLNVSENTFVVLFFGQIKKVKGLDILLESWSEIQSKAQNVLLLVAGKVWKDEEGRYREIVSKNKINRTVKFDIRYIPDGEALDYYSASDLIVLPYRKIYQSGVLLMAMSHKRAVLVSDIPGMTEIIEDGKNGFVFKNSDASDLARKILDIVEDKDSLHLIAEAAYETVLNNHSWKNIGCSTKEVYKKALL